MVIRLEHCPEYASQALHFQLHSQARAAESGDLVRDAVPEAQDLSRLLGNRQRVRDYAALSEGRPQVLPLSSAWRIRGYVMRQRVVESRYRGVELSAAIRDQPRQRSFARLADNRESPSRSII
jgi:hypothetical protein